METDRETILADFQACTDIDDVEEAIQYLEATNWDLLAAINKAMPQNTQQLPSEMMSADMDIAEEIHGSKSVMDVLPEPEIMYTSKSLSNSQSTNCENFPGTSKSKQNENKNLNFKVMCYNKLHNISLPENSTLDDLKQRIWMLTTITPCKQQLVGWPVAPKHDSDLLKHFPLPAENTLSVIQVSSLGSGRNNIADRLTQVYTLNIRDEIHNKTYNLNFPGTHTILDVKSDVYSLIDVPVRNQLWKGWPASLKDDNTILAQSGISSPEHDLSVNKNYAKESKKEIVDLVDTDSSEPEDGDDFEDASESFQVEDDIFIDNVVSRKIVHLMPEKVTDETVGTLHFSQEFEKRYGPAHPSFFVGTFEEALAEATSKSARERKLLAVYLHHDNSVLAHVFCTQLLGSEAVLQILSNNFVVWGWDFTHKSNEALFTNSINRALGPMATMTVKNIDVDTMPVLMIIMKSRSITEIFTIVHGNVGVNDLLTSLVETVQVFQEQRQSEIQSEEERHARETVKQEQDKAYQESLAVDRAKEEAKKLHEKMEKKMKEEAESERLAEEARIHAQRELIKSSLPPEPTNCEGVMKIRVRLPAGEFLERKFQSGTSLQTLLNFLFVEGYSSEDYKVLSSWPRRDLTSLDTTLTLNELKFHQQETVILEER